jgi:hypothetical protein
MIDDLGAELIGFALMYVTINSEMFALNFPLDIWGFHVDQHQHGLDLPQPRGKSNQRRRCNFHWYWN